MPEPSDTCPVCHVSFIDVETEDELISLCRPCDREIHADCMERHACPVIVRADRKALEAWNAGVRGW